jgi:hypothetical protein
LLFYAILSPLELILAIGFPDFKEYLPQAVWLTLGLIKG